MEKEFYIHVGLPKTATTYLQREYFPDIKGVHYVKTKTPMFKLQRSMQFYPTEALDVEALSQRVKELSKEIPHDKVLISDERIFGHPMFNWISLVPNADNLKAIFPNAKIIITVRNPVSFAESLYVQSLHAGWAKKKKEFFNIQSHGFGRYKDNHGISYDVKTLNYQKFIGVYEDRFGEENVLVLPYEWIKRHREDFFTRLATFIGVPPKIPAPSTGKVNRSFSHRMVKLAPFVNRLFRRERTNGFGWIKVYPFHNRLLPMYDRSRGLKQKMVGLGLAFSNQINPERFLRYFDVFGYRKPQILTEEEKNIIKSAHRATNEALDKKRELGLQELGYY